MALSQPLDLMVLGSQGSSLLAQHRLEDFREENPDISGDTPPLLVRFLGLTLAHPMARSHLPAACSTHPLSIHVLPLERLPVGRKSAAKMLRDADKE